MSFTVLYTLEIIPGPW